MKSFLLFATALLMGATLVVVWDVRQDVRDIKLHLEEMARFK